LCGLRILRGRNHKPRRGFLKNAANSEILNGQVFYFLFFMRDKSTKSTLDVKVKRAKVPRKEKYFHIFCCQSAQMTISLQRVAAPLVECH
jgi:hypothetical protein